MEKIAPIKPGPKRARVTILGLDDPGDLGPATLGLLARAKLVAGPERLLKPVLGYLGEGVRTIPLNKGLGDWLEEVKSHLDQADQAGQAELAGQGGQHDLAEAVVLADGDPNFFGLGARVIKALAGHEVTMKPAATTVQKAFARLGVSWAGAEVVSLHGRQDFAPFFSAIFRAGQTGGSGFVAVYTDAKNNPGRLAEGLIERGQTNWKMAVFQELGLAGEAVWSGDLAQAQKTKFKALNLAVLERTKPPEVLTLGAAESAYDHQAGLITKSEVRGAVLGLLELSGRETLWDLGCGSGSVALEAGMLLRHGQILAVEKDPARAAQARENRSRYGAAHVKIVEGRALETLPDLPRPDRVFVGGGGIELEATLRGVLGFLAPGGVVVAAVVRLDSLDAAISCLSEAKLPLTVTQIFASRGEPLVGSFFLKPINPVFLIKAKIPS